ncbi:MAG TPA: glycogen/starch synthase [Bacteroidota bacterium]
MKVAIAASEVAPFAKTGGLADVVGALPKFLKELGCDVKVFVPRYNSIDDTRYDLHYEHTIGEMLIRVAAVPRPVHVLRSDLPGSSVQVYFIDCPHYFHRGRLYTSDSDEDERFILFSKAVLETLQRLQWAPDVIHCNDWQTALIPILLKDNYSWDALFHRTATVLSIHNIAYQGTFPPSTVAKAELRPELFYSGGPLEMHGFLNFLKPGILHAEMISTVSETYSYEILSPLFGEGLDGVLRMRQHDLQGILNGIDTEEWNPSTDHHLPFHYSSKDMKGKLQNKKFLLDNTSIDFHEDLPVIGIVSRFAGQKGFDLFADVAIELMQMNAQWVILGSGEDRFEGLFRSLSSAMGHKVWAYVGFNNELAHLIEAGADMFLMPSHYEPCGLNQMYSLRYGTVPIVRNTGGLADTVHDWHEFTYRGLDTGNGFSFNDATGYALQTSVERAIGIFSNDKNTWLKIQRNGMQSDFSWKASAVKYLRLYERAITKRRSAA